MPYSFALFDDIETNWLIGIYWHIDDITRWREDMNFIFE